MAIVVEYDAPIVEIKASSPNAVAQFGSVVEAECAAGLEVATRPIFRIPSLLRVRGPALTVFEALRALFRPSSLLEPFQLPLIWLGGVDIPAASPSVVRLTGGLPRLHSLTRLHSLARLRIALVGLSVALAGRLIRLTGGSSGRIVRLAAAALTGAATLTGAAALAGAVRALLFLLAPCWWRP
jgi:hypothetical protein